MDRLIKYFTQLVRKAVAPFVYAGHYPYTVVSCNPTLQTLDAYSLDRRMPDVTGVPIGSLGFPLNPPPGTEVRIGFTGMDPTKPYVASMGSGGLSPIVPNSGSGVLNEIDAGYILLVVGPAPAPTNPLPVTAAYFPAGVAGQIAAQTAFVAANVPPVVATLIHLSNGRVLPDAWTVP